MEEFNYLSGGKMTESLRGKTIKSIETPEGGPDDYLVFVFTDGTRLVIRYDYIYEYALIGKEAENDGSRTTEG